SSSAATGRPTSRHRYNSDAPGPSAPLTRAEGRAGSRTRPSAAGSATGDSEGVLDPRDRSRRRVEERRVDRRPSAEVADGEQPGRRRELRRVEVGGDDRAVTVRREDLLRRVGVEEVDE